MPAIIEDSISVLVVDDHTVFAQSLAAALGGAPDIEVVGIAHNGSEAVLALQETRSQVVLLDFQLPDVVGTELITKLLNADPGLRIVVLTASVDERTVVSAMKAGCVGYVTKDQGLDDVIAAVRAVAKGQAVMPPRLLASMFPSSRPVPKLILTPRETETLQLLAQGATNEIIAATLHVTRNTVRNHVQNLLQKLNAHSRLEAVAIARAANLIND